MPTTQTGSVSLDAWLAGGRVQHHRLHDHIGADSDLYISIDDRIGPWEMGTPIHFVIQDLFDRVLALQYGQYDRRQVYSFSANAIIGWWFSADASIRGTSSGSFVVSSLIGSGGWLTLDSFFCGGSSFRINAMVIR